METVKEMLPMICPRCQTRYPRDCMYCICGGKLRTKESFDFERAREILHGFCQGKRNP